MHEHRKFTHELKRDKLVFIPKPGMVQNVHLAYNKFCLFNDVEKCFEMIVDTLIARYSSPKVTD